MVGPCKPIMSLYRAQENNPFCDNFLFLFIVISSLTSKRKTNIVDILYTVIVSITGILGNIGIVGITITK